jgi:hypothetical protein
MANATTINQMRTARRLLSIRLISLKTRVSRFIALSVMVIILSAKLCYTGAAKARPKHGM